MYKVVVKIMLTMRVGKKNQKKKKCKENELYSLVLLMSNKL